MSLIDFLYTYFKNVVVFDFEYSQTPGNNPNPVCCTFRDLKSGKQITHWYLSGSYDWPFKDEDTIYICHNAVAEVSCMLELGLKVPLHIWDSYVQEKKLYNGKELGFSLLKCCARYSIKTISEIQKDVYRDVIINNFPTYTAKQKEKIIAYNITDVDENAQLFLAQLAKYESQDKNFKRIISQALFHGRAMGVCAAIERNGIPINYELYSDMEKYFPAIKAQEIAELSKVADIYVGDKWNQKKFEKFLEKENLLKNWPRTKTGQPAQDDKTLYRNSAANPKIQQIRDSKFIIGAKNLKGYCVGKDKRSRAPLKMFGQITGRTNVSTAINPFGAPRRMRNIIGTNKHMIIAYADWKSQEAVIQAALSQDPNVIKAVKQKDVYIFTGQVANAIPPGNWTKYDYPVERELYKQTFLATAYGQTAFGLKAKLNCSEAKATYLLSKLHYVFPTYFKWIEELIKFATARGYLETKYGWKYFMPDIEFTNPRRLMNWPLQSHGSEILRRAMIDLYDSGFEISMPVHDALLIHMERKGCAKKLKKLKTIMSAAAEKVIGMSIPVDIKIIRKGYDQDNTHQERWNALYQKLLRAKECTNNGQ